MSLLVVSLPMVVIVTVRYGADLLAFCRQLFNQAVKLTRGHPTVSIDKTHAFVFSNCTHGQVDSVLETFHLYSDSHPSLCIGQEKGEFLDEVVSNAAPRLVLELGMHCGYSSVRILRLLGPAGRLLAVEQDPETADKGEEIILVAGFKHPQFQVLTCPSAVAIAGLQAHMGDAQGLDLILMDHDVEQYLPDLLALEKWGVLSPGCVLLVNGIFCTEARPFLEHIQARPLCYTQRRQLQGLMELTWNRASDVC
ncbi:catechol O-methyltransferase-like isoform X1 [Alosa sapidissima]|uniref:catechol O-methyltransferase-like isoform X1 n=1 Tax=Alosa sapidissima TaxID=34773 RepID=UPI001C08CB1A|nr:catechol O-methyltransferase-like isoform X1 [Alosa sapidissima]